MSIFARKLLLASTALVAASFIMTSVAQAAVVAATLDGSVNDQWAGAGNGAAGTQDGKAKNARAGDTVEINGAKTLSISNNQTADDGSANKDTFVLGAVTNSSAGAGSITILQTSAGTTNPFDVTIGSVTDTAGTTSMSISSNSTVGQNATVSVSGNLTLHGNLSVVDTNAAAADSLTALSIGGDANVTGTTTITAGSSTTNNASSTITVSGANNTFTGAVTLTGGANAASQAGLQLSGGAGTTTFTGGVTLNDGTAGTAGLTVAGTAAQTVTGTVNSGGSGSLGALNSNNAAGKVTLSSAIGGASSATRLRLVDLEGVGDGTNANEFQSTVRAKQLKIGHATGQDTFDADVNVDTVDFTAANTTGKGEYFKGNLTGAVNFAGNDGLVTLAAGKTLTGTVNTTTDITGTLTLEGAGTVTGAIGATSSLNALNAGLVGTSSFNETVNVETVTVTGTGTIDFKKALTSTNVNFSAAGTIDFEGNATGDISFAGNNGNIVLSADKNIIGTVDATTNDKGTLTLAGGTQDVSGAIGSTQKLHAVVAGQGSTAVSTFEGAVNATTITVGAGRVNLDGGGSGTVNFAGDGVAHLGAGGTFTGAVSTSAASTGTFVFDGAGTVSSTLGAGNVLKALTVSGAGVTANVTGNLAAANTTTLGTNTLHTGGTYTQGASQTLNVSVTGAATNGKITANGAATVAANSKVKLTFDRTFTNNTAIGVSHNYTVIDGTGGVGIGAVTLQGPGFWHLTQVGGAGTEDLVVMATRQAIQAVGSGANNRAVSVAIGTIADSGSTTLGTIAASVAAAPTTAATNAILSRLLPTVDGSAQEGTMSIASSVQDLTTAHLSSIRSGDSTSGVSSGYSSSGVNVWLQGFGQHANQDMRGEVAGYNANTWGGTLGIDSSNLIPQSVVGLAVSYGKANVSSANANTTSTSVDSYGFDLYGTYNMQDNTFVDAQAGYAYNDIDTTRHDVNGPGTGVNADGTTRGDQYSAKLGLGHDYIVGNTVLTPVFSADYLYLNTAAYHEKGAGANLQVDSVTTDALNLGVDLKAAWRLHNASGAVLKPSVHAGYAYDVLGDNISTTANFVDADPTINPTFSTQGPAAAHERYTAGAGFTYEAVSNWDLSAAYNYTYKKDYDAHSGVIRATTPF